MFLLSLPVANFAASRASSLSSSDLSLSACVTMVTGVIPILKIKESLFDERRLQVSELSSLEELDKKEKESLVEFQ